MCLLAGAAACNRRTPGFDGLVFVANEGGRAVAVVKVDEFVPLRHIRLPAAPTALLAHAARRTVYALTPSTGTVHEIDASRLEVVRRVQPAATATSMLLAPGGDALWVMSAASRRLVRVPLDTFRADPPVRLSQEPLDFDIAGETNAIVVAYGKPGWIETWDLATGRRRSSTQISAEAGRVRFRRPDGNAVLTADLANRALVVSEVASGAVMSRLPLALRPENFCFNEDGGQVFITGAGMDAVVVVYPHYVPQIAETALAGPDPAAMTASSRLLLVSSPSSGEVTVLNVDTRRVLAVATVGSQPAFVAVTPDEQYALVLNSGSGDMAVLRIGNLAPSRNRALGLLTMVPVGSKPVAAVILRT